MAPAIALAFLGVSLAAIPFGAPVGGTWLVTMAALGGAAVLIARASGGDRWRTVTIWPVLAVLASYAISAVCSSMADRCVARSASMPLHAFAFIAVQVVAWNPRALRLLLWLVAGACVLISIDVLCQWLFGRSIARGILSRGPRFIGSQANANDLASMPILMPFAMAAFGGRRSVGIVLVAALTAPAWLLSASRQVLVGWLVACCGPIVTAWGSRRGWSAVAGLVTLTCIALASLPALRGRVAETVSQGIGVRGPIAAYGLELFAGHPIVGVGPGVFGEHYRSAAAAGWQWQGHGLPKVGIPWVHSLPIEVLCEFGALGGVAFGAVFAVGCARAWRACRRGGVTMPIARAVLASLAVVAIVGLVDLTFIKDWFRVEWWLVLGFAFSLEKSPTPAGVDQRPPAC